MSGRGWALFAAVSVLWGIPYLFIKVAVDDLSPGFLAWARLAIATAALAPFAVRARSLRGMPLGPVLAFATVEMIVPWPLIGFGEQRVASSLAAILIATVPLLVVVLTLAGGAVERPTRRQLAGIGVGLVGVTALVGVDVSGTSRELAGVAALLVAALGYATGAIIVDRGLGGRDPLGLIAGASLTGTVVLAPVGIGAWPSEIPPADAIAAVATLGLVCSAVAFLLFVRLVEEAGPTRATLITYVNPVVALLLGAAVLDERLTVAAAGGLVLILVGSRLAAVRQA